MTNQDDLFGAKTWEEAESNMQKEACVLALGKAHVPSRRMCAICSEATFCDRELRLLWGLRRYRFPCSDCTELVPLQERRWHSAAMSVAAGYGDYMLAVTSSHFGSAEKEFRFPLGYANQRPLIRALDCDRERRISGGHRKKPYPHQRGNRR